MVRARGASWLPLLRRLGAYFGVVPAAVSLHRVEVAVLRRMHAAAHARFWVDVIPLEVLAGFAADHGQNGK